MKEYYPVVPGVRVSPLFGHVISSFLESIVHSLSNANKTDLDSRPISTNVYSSLRGLIGE